MGLLDHLFRHKSAIPENRAIPQSSGSAGEMPSGSVRPEPKPAPPVSRSLGAVATAIGLHPDRGMPEVFEVSLDDLLRRAPQLCVTPGRHDPSRIVRVPSAEIADGISKGRAELPLARLVALAPDIFRSGPDDSTDPRVLLPLQKLLQQIGSHAAEAKRDSSPDVGVENVISGSQETSDMAIPFADAGAAQAPVEREIIRAHLPSISWGGVAEHEVASPVAEQSTASVSETTLETPTEPIEPPRSPPASETPQADLARSSPETLAPSPPQDVHDFVPAPIPDSVELRGQTAVPTPGAVVLGGSSVSGRAEPSQILAPKVPLAPSATPSIILAPVSTEVGVTVPVQPVEQTASKPSIAGLARTAAEPAERVSSTTKGHLDPAAVAAEVVALPGVHACVITSGRGTVRAGQYPAGLDAESLRALAVEIGNYADARASRLHIGRVENTTLHRGDCEIAVFVREGVCLSVVLDPNGFAPGVRKQLVRHAELLAGAP